MRRFLIATLTALALAFALAGCHDAPHFKVPRLPDKVHDLYNSNPSNMYRHASNERYHNLCHDDQGIPYDC